MSTKDSVSARKSVAAVGAAALLACFGGCGSDSSRDTREDGYPSPTVETAAGAAQGREDQPETADGIDEAAGPVEMDEAAFWQLIEETRAAGANETGKQSELLEERLAQLPPEQIADFGRIRRELDEKAYTWELWAAAYVIEDGCSDDCFRDFRAYLISLERAPYEAALAHPDSLAAIVEDAETGDWENADNVAPDAYESVTDDDFPGGDSDLRGKPSGRPWDDEDEGALTERYPQLAARFR